LQSRLRIQPIDALVIHDTAFLAQLQVDHARAVPAVTMRQRDNAIAQARIRIRSRRVPQGGSAHADDGQRAPLAEAARDHLPHRHAARGGGHH
jgi:hypothetical protein